MSRVFDERLPQNDWRRKVATLHQHITDTGEAGHSGQYDPKAITDTVNGIKYAKMLDEPTATCDLCLGGDMISPWKRFLYSRYRPGHRFWHEPWRWARIAWGRCRAMMGLLTPPSVRA